MKTTNRASSLKTVLREPPDGEEREEQAEHPLQQRPETTRHLLQPIPHHPEVQVEQTDQHGDEPGDDVAETRDHKPQRLEAQDDRVKDQPDSDCGDLVDDVEDEAERLPNGLSLRSERRKRRGDLTEGPAEGREHALEGIPDFDQLTLEILGLRDEDGDPDHETR
jgi:hypothetical protein